MVLAKCNLHQEVPDWPGDARLLLLVTVATTLMSSVAWGMPFPNQQAKPDSHRPAIQGRLLDENKSPIVDVSLRPCRSVKDPDGSERTMFPMYKDGTWARTRTGQDGRFVFDGELAPGTYCLAAETQGSLVPKKLSRPNGEMIKIELTVKSPKLDLGDVVVKW